MTASCTSTKTPGDRGFAGVGTFGSIVASVDGATWTWRSSGQTTNVVRGVEAIAHSDKTFVAVGSGNILTSADGITWTTTVSETNSPYGVTFANGMFVAVGSRLDRTYMSGGNGVVMTSADGSRWNTIKLEDGLVLEGVTSADKKFVAVGHRAGVGRVLSSTDAVTWSEVHAGNEKLTSVAHANGRFVAVGAPDALTSDDGVAWTPRKLPDALELNGVAYGNGLFVAVSAPYFVGGLPGGLKTGEGHVLTSPDGVVWRKSSELGASSIAFANGEFVAAGADTEHYGFVTSSPDGSSWTPRKRLSQLGLNAVAHGGGRVVVGGFHGIILSR